MWLLQDLGEIGIGSLFRLQSNFLTVGERGQFPFVAGGKINPLVKLADQLSQSSPAVAFSCNCEIRSVYNNRDVIECWARNGYVERVKLHPGIVND